MPSKFADLSSKSNLKQKRTLSKFIDQQVLLLVKKNIHLQYVFVNDEDLINMNQQFLQHNTYTDIITFDLSENNNKIIGEIYISIDRVKENALKFKVDYIQELHRVIFHGMLHLCGYKDKSKQDKTAMRTMEDKCLKVYF